MVANNVLAYSQPDSSIGDELLRLQQQQRIAQQRQQQDEDDKIKYLAGQLDFKNFATGTAADPVINENLNGLMQKYMMRVRDNKGESLSSLLMDMSKDVGGLKQYSLNAQGVRKGIEARSKEFGENKDIDASGLQRDAMAMAFFKTDPATGQLVPRGADEIDPNTDYTGQLLQRQKGRYIKGRSGLYNYIKGMEESALGDTNTRDKNGMKKTVTWSAKVKPFEELIKDAQGNPTGTRIMQDKPIKIGDKEVITFPKEAYDKLFGGQEWDAYIEADLDEKIRQAKQQDPRFDVTDPRQIDVLKRAIAYDYLKAFRPQGDFTTKDVEDQSSLAEKIAAGFAAGSRGGSGGGSSSGTKTDETDYVQAYKEIDEATTLKPGESRPYTQANMLPTKGYEAVIKIAKERVGVSGLGAQDIKLVRDKDGNIDIVSAQDIFSGEGPNAVLRWGKNKFIARLDKKGVDLKVNTRAPEQRKIVKEGDKPTTSNKPAAAKKYMGLDANGNPIFK